MADKYGPDSGTGMSTDRARRINSLHRSVDELVQEQNKKRLQVSTEISALTKEQQRMMRELEMERGEFTNETASAYNSVVKNLGKTIQNLSMGVKNITMETAKATSSAIGQYGKAIGEDISLNKQNTMAMALSRATPLFGYFAAKFMETEAFQESARRIKEKVGGAMSSAGESLKNIFSKKQAAELEGEPPKLQRGGFVKKGGLVEVHAAEVVSPIEKIMSRLDNGVNEKVLEQLKTFHEDFTNMSKTSGGEQKKLLKSLNELKVAMVGTASRLEIAWQRTLLNHPTLRGMLMFGQTMQSVITAPFRALFGIRGGFATDIKRATSTTNVYKQQVNLLALIYSRGMTYLRNIDKYTKVTAEALVGEPVSPVTSKTYTLFGQIREFMTTRNIGRFKDQAFQNFIDSLGLDRGALKEAGIEGFNDILAPHRILRNMGVTRENILGKMSERAGGQTEERTYREFVSDTWKNISDNISSLAAMKKAQEKREGPHSPSMADNVATTAKESRKQTSFLSGIGDKFKKFGGKIASWFPLLFGFLSKIGNTIFGIGKFLGSILKGFGGFMAGGAMKGIGNIGKGLGGMFAGAKGAAAAGGARGLLGYGIGGVGRVAGAAAGALGGAVVGGAMSMYDIIKAIINPEDWAAGVVARAFGAFLGGTKTGVKGMTSGALKGAALGAAAGSVVPGFGTALGAGIGAVAGSILGFVGGERLSVAIQNTMDSVKDIISGIWQVVKFPFQALKELTKSAWVIMKFSVSKVWNFVDEWLSGPGFIGTMWDGLKGIFSSIIDRFSAIWDSIKMWVKEHVSVEKVKEFITNALFPFPLIIQTYKELGSMADGWISGLPVIGRIYTKIKGGIKAIRSGDMSESLKRALEGKPELISDAQREKLSAKEIADLYAKEETNKQSMITGEIERQTKAMKSGMENQTKVSTAAMFNSAQLISSNTNTVNNTGGGGWGSGWNSTFSPGSGVAEKVAAANIN